MGAVGATLFQLNSPTGPGIVAGAADPSAGGGVAATPGSIYLRTGTAQVWQKTGAGATAWGQMAVLNAAQTYTGAQNVAMVTLADAATISTNAALSNEFQVTINGNRLLDDPANLVAGGTYIWEITQGAGAPFTLTYGGKFTWRGGTPPTLSTAPGATDIITAFYNGTKLRAVASIGFA